MSKACHRAPSCVVTGAAGFVGSHLAEALLKRGFEVIGIDNFFSGHRENLVPLEAYEAFRFHQRCITEPGLLKCIKGDHPEAAVCFHLAAVVSVPYSVEHPDECRRVNLEATRALLQQARELRFDAFVFAGSAAEYGCEQRLPIAERYACDETPRLSPYGQTKYEASKVVAGCGSRPRGVALRCFNIYGPRQDPNSPYSGVISRFVKQAGEGRSLTIFGDGGQTRDFIFVGDVVAAYLAAAGLSDEYDSPPAGIYNVGCGIRVSVLELAKIIQRLTGGEESFKFYPERPGDIRDSQADIGRFCRQTGWRPRCSFEQGLNLTINWMTGGASMAADQRRSVPGGASSLFTTPQSGGDR